MKYLTTAVLLSTAAAFPQTTPTTVETVKVTATTTESFTSLTTTTKAVVPETTITTAVVVPVVPTKTTTTTKVVPYIATETVVSTQNITTTVVSTKLNPTTLTATTTVVQKGTSPSREEGCHNGMNWWQFKGPEWIDNPLDETHDETIIAIGSPWNLGHNHDVWHKAIEEVDLVPFNRSRDLEKEEYEHCGWRNLVEIRRLGVLIAKIDYYSLEKDFNTSNADSLRKYKPSEELENALITAIKPLYPWREITLLTVVGILGPLLLFAGLAFCCLGAKRRSRGKN